MCDNIIHEEVVKDVKKKMESVEKNNRLALFFKVFGDETRLKIMNALMIHKMCVCDISALLQMSQSSISHQLKQLRQLNLVRTEKIGKVVYYSLSDNHIKSIYQKGLEHICEVKNENL